RVRQLTAAPVLETVDLALARLDQRLVALDHGRNLLALVRMDQEHDFVMTHWYFLVDSGPDQTGPGQPPATRKGAVGQGSIGRAEGSGELWQVTAPAGKRAS